MRVWVVLWAVPGARAALASYEDEVLPLLPRYGGRVLQRVRVTGSGPAELHLLELPDEAALRAFRADPDRAALEVVREACLARVAVTRPDDRHGS